MELFTPFIEDAERTSRRGSEPPKKAKPRTGPIFDDLPYSRPRAHVGITSTSSISHLKNVVS